MAIAGDIPHLASVAEPWDSATHSLKELHKGAAMGPPPSPIHWCQAIVSCMADQGVVISMLTPGIMDWV